jgi:tetratricopeptide (TPR) repeat protein
VTEGDLLGATDLYRRALELVGDSHPNSAVYNSLMAECLYRLSDLRDRDPEMLARAETIFSRLETEAPDSLATQNLLLFRTLRNQTDFSTEESLESARKIEHYLGPVVAELDASTPLPDEQATLAPTMAAYLAGYHYWTGGYPESMKWLKIYDRLGPTSYSARANTLFRIARIAETKLGDPDTAAKYYRRFNREIRSDNRIFFAGERAELLESGTTESRKGSGHGK